MFQNIFLLFRNYGGVLFKDVSDMVLCAAGLLHRLNVSFFLVVRFVVIPVVWLSW